MTENKIEQVDRSVRARSEPIVLAAAALVTRLSEREEILLAALAQNTVYIIHGNLPG